MSAHLCVWRWVDCACAFTGAKGRRVQQPLPSLSTESHKAGSLPDLGSVIGQLGCQLPPPAILPAVLLLDPRLQALTGPYLARYVCAGLHTLVLTVA